MKGLFVTFLLCFSLTAIKAQDRWQTIESKVKFSSDAPLEFIEATSKELRGILVPAKKLFAFSIPIRSFQGFNSPLQREHFNENYMESNRFPKATFSGRIIGSLDLSSNGTLSFRAKGKLVIHGVEQERIIKVLGKLEEEKLSVSAQFTVLLEEYGIAIPRIVHQKIAEEIKIHVEATFGPI